MAINASPYNPNDPANPNNNVGVNPTGTPSITGAGGVGIGAPQGVGAPGSSGAVQGSNAPAGSGQFVNLQKYLDANAGAGAAMAGQIAQKGQNQADTIGNTINQANTTVGSQLDAEKNRIAQATGFANQTQQDPLKMFGGYNPTTGYADQTGFNQYQQLLKGTTNAQDLTNQITQAFNPAQSQLNDFQTYANQAGNEAGRFQLLQQAMGRPTYTPGQQKLDQLLLQNDNTGALNSLQQNLANQASTAQNALNTSQQNLNTGISSLTPAALSAQQQLKGAVGTISNPGDVGTGALGALQQQLNISAANQVAQQTGLKNDILTETASSPKTALVGPNQQMNLDPQVLKALGLTYGQHLYGLDPSRLAELAKAGTQFAPDTITPQSMATDADVARYQALNALSGNSGPGTYLTQAGTPVTVNTGNAQKAIADALKTGNDQFNANQGTYQNLMGQINPYAGQFGSNAAWVNNLANMNPNDLSAAVTKNVGTVPGAWNTNNDPHQGYQQLVDNLINWNNQYQALNPNLIAT